MPRAVQVPGIREAGLPGARQAIRYVHACLRECVLDGTVPPGARRSRVSLAAQPGISRAPAPGGAADAAGGGPGRGEQGALTGMAHHLERAALRRGRPERARPA
ncbi:MAG: hypothetical protein ACRDNT_27255 [Streptosporangiaceae bacterium]